MCSKKEESVPMMIRVKKNTKSKLENYADKNGVSQSSIMNIALTQYLDKEGA